MESKQCNTCKKIKPLSEFSKRKNSYQNKCKKCAREYYLKNKDKKKCKTPISISLDEIQLKLLDYRVVEFNSNRNDYIINCLMNDLLKPIIKIDFSSLDNLAYEINKIGVNINQIARIANSDKHIYKSDIEYLREKQERIEEMLCNYYDIVLRLQRKKR